jgi:uncharacterized RDD family membrane protein YckC
MANQFGDPNADDQRPHDQPGGGQPGSGQPTYGQWPSPPPGQPGYQPYGAPPPGYQTGPAAQPGGYAFGAPPYVSWLSRVGSYILDFLPAWVLYGIGSAIAVRGVTLVFDLAGLAWIIWNRWVRAGQTGQSVGKSALNSRLIDERTGQPIGGGMAFVRDIAHIVDAIICYVGFLFPLWDSKRQTLADKILHTVVVRSDGTGGSPPNGQPGYAQQNYPPQDYPPAGGYGPPPRR